MANFQGATLALTTTVLDGAGLTLDGAANATSAVINGRTFLYVPAVRDDAIQIFEIGTGGALTPLGFIADTGTTALNATRTLLSMEVDGNQYLAASGFIDDGVTMYALSDTGPYLTAVDTVFDNESSDHEMNGALNLSTYELFGKQILLVAGNIDGGISAFEVASNGTLTNIGNVDDSDNPNFTLRGNAMSDVFFRSGVPFVAVGSTSEYGMTILRLDSVGNMLLEASFDGNADLVYPQRPAAYVMGGDVYLVATAAFEAEVYLFKYDGSNLTLEQRIESPLFNNATQVQLIEVGDQVFFATASVGTEGLTLLEFDTDFFELSLVQTVESGTGQGAIDRAQLGGVITYGSTQYLVVASENEDAINLYEIGGGEDLIEGTRLADSIQSGGGDDVINALSGDDFVDAGDGDDIINTGGGADFVVGGAGDDVINTGSGNDTVEDGAGDDVVNTGSGDDQVFAGSGQDQLNGGSGTDLLIVATPGPDGAEIDFLRGTLTFADGTIQGITGFENAVASFYGDTVIGDDLANVLDGSDGDDLIRGRAGDDTLIGGLGDDRLVGADGDDTLTGGFGFDRLAGGNGNDVMLGEGQNDKMFGGGGNDTMFGGGDDDVMKGNDGDDDMGGDGGNDRLEGQQGNDFLRGGGGDDVILGGGGRDRINGGDGNDLLTGGSAIDTFVFLTDAAGGGGVNRITDFQDGLDLMDVSGYGFANVGQILALSSQSGADTRIDFADGQVVLLEQFIQTDLDASDFVF